MTKTSVSLRIVALAAWGSAALFVIATTLCVAELATGSRHPFDEGKWLVALIPVLPVAMGALATGAAAGRPLARSGFLVLSAAFVLLPPIGTVAQMTLLFDDTVDVSTPRVLFAAGMVTLLLGWILQLAATSTVALPPTLTAFAERARVRPSRPGRGKAALFSVDVLLGLAIVLAVVQIVLAYVVHANVEPSSPYIDIDEDVSVAFVGTIVVNAVEIAAYLVVGLFVTISGVGMAWSRRVGFLLGGLFFVTTPVVQAFATGIYVSLAHNDGRIVGDGVATLATATLALSAVQAVVFGVSLVVLGGGGASAWAGRKAQSPSAAATSSFNAPSWPAADPRAAATDPATGWTTSR